jgi:hypothetical protein
MKPTLQWPKQPSKSRHPILGRRLRWTDRSKVYRIERFPDDGDPLFIVLFNDGAWRVMSRHRKLRPAKLYCQTHYRETERRIRVRRS